MTEGEMEKDMMIAAAATDKGTSEKPLTLDEIAGRERESHRNFFGQEFDLSGFVRTLERYGEGKITLWQKLGLEPHYLPPISMSPDKDFPGWKIRPGKWLCQQVAEGLIWRNPWAGCGIMRDNNVFMMEGITVLIDTRLKPDWLFDRILSGHLCSRS